MVTNAYQCMSNNISIPQLGVRIDLASIQEFINSKLNLLAQWSTPLSQFTFAQTSSAILAILQTNRFSRNKGKFSENNKKVIHSAVASGISIPLSVVCGPLKNRLLEVGQKPDWAEVFLYAQLASIDKAVKEIYSPGISVELILDDARCQFANGVEDSVFKEYAQNLANLLTDLNLNSNQIVLSSQKPIYEKININKYISEAESIVTEFIKSESGQSNWNTVTRNSCENNSEGCDTEAAAVRYMIAQEAEVLAGFWQNPERIMLRYGRNPEEVQRLWTVRKGSTALPWQGLGGILVLPDGDLRPCVWQPYRECGLKILGFASMPYPISFLTTHIPILFHETYSPASIACKECCEVPVT